MSKYKEKFDRISKKSGNSNNKSDVELIQARRFSLNINIHYLMFKNSSLANTSSIFQIKSSVCKTKNYFLTQWVTLLLCGFYIVGCTTYYAPVEQRSASKYNVKKKYTGKTPRYHLVKKGDTLYSIAWMYGLDYKSIAYKNRIKPPYHIFVGDKLLLKSAYTKNSTYNTKSAKVTDSKRRQTNKRTVTYKKGTDSKNAVRKNTTSSKTRKSAKSQSTSNAKRAVSIQNKTATFTGSKRLNWSWPVKGKVIQRYSPGSGKKGIDISASKGTLIKSSEAGKVVYSGQGLAGYGRLIIIKHNDTYLSAYAHNQSLLVNEGQLVKKGQNIARLGRSGTDRYKLHFEIRKNGKPVNPMSYLPR